LFVIQKKNIKSKSKTDILFFFVIPYFFHCQKSIKKSRTFYFYLKLFVPSWKSRNSPDYHRDQTAWTFVTLFTTSFYDKTRNVHGNDFIFVVLYSLFVVRCSISVIRCSLFDIRYSLFKKRFINSVSKTDLFYFLYKFKRYETAECPKRTERSINVQWTFIANGPACARCLDSIVK
jgi:hypothetical protein